MSGAKENAPHHPNERASSGTVGGGGGGKANSPSSATATATASGSGGGGAGKTGASDGESSAASSAGAGGPQKRKKEPAPYEPDSKVWAVFVRDNTLREAVVLTRDLINKPDTYNKKTCVVVRARARPTDRPLLCCVCSVPGCPSC
jgi:hypothetical protein